MFGESYPVTATDISDRLLGHPSVDQAFTDAGLRPLGARYVNLPGWFAWLLMVRLADRPRTNPKMVRLYDRTVILVQRRLEPRFAPPSGQSVFGSVSQSLALA